MNSSSNVVSLPVVPAQPQKAQYGIGELELFQTYMTVEEYRAVFGEAPPAFDPNFRPKCWRDDSVSAEDPEAEIEYLVPRFAAGQWKLVRTILPAWEARKVNIPSTTVAATPSNPEWEGRGRPPRENPVRPLLPNESLISGFGSICLVVRADLMTEQQSQREEFLPSDRMLLKAIAAKLGVAS